MEKEELAHGKYDDSVRLFSCNTLEGYQVAARNGPEAAPRACYVGCRPAQPYK